MTGGNGWTLGIDYGTTHTCAAVAAPGGESEILQIEGEPRLPSLVVESDGNLLTGRVARNQLALRPRHAERTPKRHLGVLETLPIGSGVTVTAAVAAVLTRILEEARLRFDRSDPARVVLTHPVRWEDERLDALRAAAAEAGLAHVELVAEPIAAALHFAAGGAIPTGAHVAVYDLGGGTYDTAVLRSTGTGFEVAGVPGGDPDIGGERFDEALLGHVGALIAAQDPTGWAALSDPNADRRTQRDFLDLRERIRDGKEDLSRNQVTDIHVLALERSVRVTREEFEELIGPDVTDTVAELADTLRAANIAPSELHALYLTGDSSRVPAIARALHSALAPLTPTNRADPKAVVVLGATRPAHARADATGPRSQTAVVEKAHPSPQKGPVGRTAPKLRLVGTPQLLWRERHGSDPARVTFTGDGSSVASTADALWGRDLNLQLRRTESGEIVPRHLGGNPRDPVVAGPDFLVARPQARGTVCSWEVPGSGLVLHTFTRDEGYAAALAVSADGRQVAISWGSGALDIWNAQSGQSIRSLGESHQAAWLAFNAAGTHLAYASAIRTQDARVAVWDIASGQCQALSFHERRVDGAGFSPETDTLATKSHTKLMLWDPPWSGAPKIIHLDGAGGGGLAYSPDGHWLALGGWAVVKVWDVLHRRMHWSLDTQQPQGRRGRAIVKSVSWSNDGHHLAAGDSDGGISVWRVV